ncbi:MULTISPECIES: UrcA family protein [Phenylobacterium]|uniref:UrcA family protein n=1 Tax=Phenylobacterium koreense TaxID=266125 RepID=A0ABV2ELZ2_9CAUL
MKTPITFAMAAIAFLSVTGGARAEYRPALRTATVAYEDLDLSRSGGRAMLERRIALAVRKVCPDIPHPLRLEEQFFYSQCRKAAWDSAASQVAAASTGTQLAKATITLSGKPRR